MFKNFKEPRIAIFAAIILVAIFLSYRYFTSGNAADFMMPQDIKVVEAEKLQLKDIAQTTKLIGTIKAKNFSMLTAQDEGILEIISDSGSVVKKGDLLAKINNLEREKNYQLSIDAEAIAKSQYQRAQTLIKTGAINKNEFEKSKNFWIDAQMNLANAKIALDKLTFYAPFDGVVGHYKIKSGEQVQTGSQIVSFYDPSFVRVDFDIPVSDIAYVNNGQNVSILGKNYQLQLVQKILDEAKHMVPVSVDIDCKDCIIGANVDVELALQEKKQVVAIPFEAVFLKNGNLTVYTIEDNRAVLKNIELGLREKDLVEVISGLKAEEMLIIKGSGRLYPGIEVKIYQPGE